MMPILFSILRCILTQLLLNISYSMFRNMTLEDNKYLWRLIMLCLLSVPPTLVLGQSTDEKTPAEKVFYAWLSAINSGSAQQLEAYKAAYHKKWAVQTMLDSWERTGGYRVVRVEKSEPLNFTVLIEEKESDALHRENVAVDTSGNDINVKMTIEDISRPSDLAIHRLSQSEAIQSLIRRTDTLTRAGRFSGAVLVASGNKVLLNRAWGEMDKEKHVLNTIHTQFRNGSMNKMFTAIAILQLVEKGKVALDSTVGDYIKDYPNKDIARVTVRRLLNHTGGTGDIFGPEFDANRTSLRDNSDYVKLYGSRGPDQSKGFSYSNYGFVLLGEIVSRVSHMSYYSYIDKYIFKPANMNSTGELPENVHLPMRAPGYMRVKGAWVRNDETLPYRGMAAGGGYSTVDDMLRFVNALQAGKLISKTMLDLAIKPYFHDAPSGYGYGLGFELYGDKQLISFGHEGGADGMNGELRVFPKMNRVIVVLSNLDPPAAHRLVDYYSLRMPVK
ncbi:serine hydrolase domain-containing protein [Chitinophaga tropicalis]|uniref:Serine hydrolase n=1 Tax=Chitinophaga tropicalis TaxID=2683588 RepID=A0A7K1TX77_9BACT|nr:serine hydrolase domain-containing protein [Chitinophaga tropicalis]MVT06709.1 serine hydrolase [Chitinophaga tropicalis]